MFLAVKAIIGGLAKVSYKLVPHRGCTFVGYIVQQMPDAPCYSVLLGFPKIRAVGGIGRANSFKKSLVITTLFLTFTAVFYTLTVDKQTTYEK